MASHADLPHDPDGDFQASTHGEEPEDGVSSSSDAKSSASTAQDDAESDFDADDFDENPAFDNEDTFADPKTLPPWHLSGMMAADVNDRPDIHAYLREVRYHHNLSQLRTGSLLDFPNELLAQVAGHLDVRSLLQFRACNRRSRDLLTGSSLIEVLKGVCANYRATLRDARESIVQARQSASSSRTTTSPPRRPIAAAQASHGLIALDLSLEFESAISRDRKLKKAKGKCRRAKDNCVHLANRLRGVDAASTATPYEERSLIRSALSLEREVKEASEGLESTLSEEGLESGMSRALGQRFWPSTAEQSSWRTDNWVTIR